MPVTCFSLDSPTVGTLGEDAAIPPAIRLANDARQMPGYHHSSSTQYLLHFPRVIWFAKTKAQTKRQQTFYSNTVYLSRSSPTRQFRLPSV